MIERVEALERRALNSLNSATSPGSSNTRTNAQNIASNSESIRASNVRIGQNAVGMESNHKMIEKAILNMKEVQRQEAECSKNVELICNQV